MKSNADLTHIEHEKESLSAELSGRKQELEQSKKLLDNQRAEEAKLRRIIAEASTERTRQKKELEQVRIHDQGRIEGREEIGRTNSYLHVHALYSPGDQ